MTDIGIRDAAAGDTGAIARVAIAAGQDEEWAGSDPAYIRYLLARGRMVVAEHRGTVTGYGATIRIGTGPAAVTMLCDLFVDPRSHGLGLGRAMLAALWRDGTTRMTFSSLHAHALPLYTRSGLDAWWPLLYLGGDVAGLARPAGWTVSPTAAGAVAGLEQQWTGIDRAADHEAWAARPGGQPVLAERDGQPMAAGAVAGEGPEYGIVHLALSPGCGDAEARDAVKNPKPKPFPWFWVALGVTLVSAGGFGGQWLHRWSKNRYRVHPSEVVRMIEDGKAPIIVDARRADSYEQLPLTIRGSVRLAPEDLTGSLTGLDLDKARPVVAYCT